MSGSFFLGSSPGVVALGGSGGFMGSWVNSLPTKSAMVDAPGLTSAETVFSAAGPGSDDDVVANVLGRDEGGAGPLVSLAAGGWPTGL